MSNDQTYDVLILCTGNSCRSIMGEALVNHLGAGRFKAVSAGSSPAGYVHPGTLAALKRAGLSTADPRSKSWDEFAGCHFDYVITVCDQAAGETCPIFAGAPRKLHWSTPDPAKATGSDAEVKAAFDTALHMLKKHIEEELL